MKIENMKMPPFNTAVMGVLRGVADYYGIKVSDAMPPQDPALWREHGMELIGPPLVV